jgi:hypothetical protein
MTGLASLFSVLIPFADAPNPADCPHHQCDYHPVTAGGIAAALVVVIVVAALLLALTVALLRRRRRRARAGGVS